MQDDVSDIADFCSSDPLKEHGRLQEHQLEWELTWRYLERYLPAQGRILEVGAASGRYTLELARRGYQVTAVDMSAALLEIARSRATAAGFTGQLQFIVADARDLGRITRNDYDAALIMGPLYHLVEATDRILALQQVVERLRPGGILCSAFISRYGMMGDLIKKLPYWIEDQAEVRSILARGRRADETRRGGFRGYFARVDELTSLHEAVGLERIVLAGVEPAISADDDSYNRLAGRQRQLWLDLLFELSTEPSIIGASRHLLYIGRRP